MKAENHTLPELNLREPRADMRTHLRKGLRVGLLATVSASAIALSATSAMAAGRVFYDGFEDGTTNAWQQYVGRNKCSVVSGAFDGGVGPKSGSRMARCNYNGVVDWDNPASYETMVLRSWSMSRETLIRFWVRVDSDVDAKAGSKLFRWGGNLASSFGAIQFEHGTGATLFTYFENGNGGQIGSTNWGSGSAFRDGKWHKIEMYLKKSQSGGDGAIKLWIDGSLAWQAANVSTTSSYSWTEFLMMSNWSTDNGVDNSWAHDGNNHIYWDEFEIYSDAGSGASGSLVDATITGSGSTSTATTTIPPAPTLQVIGIQ